MSVQAIRRVTKRQTAGSLLQVNSRLTFQAKIFSTSSTILSIIASENFLQNCRFSRATMEIGLVWLKESIKRIQ